VRLVTLPLSWIYGCAVRLHNPGVSAHQASIPIISVGNIEVGGTGKSPVAQAVCRALQAKGLVPAILSRGYGGRLKGPVRVDLTGHTADMVGDEPLMHARAGFPVFIGGDRRKSAQLAAAQGINVAVLDDGHATKSVAKDLSVLVFRPGFSARPYLLPAGRLREPLANGLRRADWVIVNGQPTNDDLALLASYDLPCVTGTFHVSPVDEAQHDQPFVLVTGVANPARVITSAEALGLAVRQHMVFPDHHQFNPADLEAIANQLSVHRGKLLTTAKDAERLPTGILKDAVVLRGQWQPNDPRHFDGLLTQFTERFAAV